MIVLLLICLLITIVQMICEMVYERDWPRCTSPAFFLVVVFLLLFGSISASAQAVRVDIPLLTSGPNVPVTGQPYPQTLWISNATANVCVHVTPPTVNTLANCLATPITTYTNSSESTACPVASQMVALPGTTCAASVGLLGNVGFWYAGGTVDYFVTTIYGSFGPYTVSNGGGGGGGGVSGSGTAGDYAKWNGPTSIGNGYLQDATTNTLDGGSGTALIANEPNGIALTGGGGGPSEISCTTASGCAGLEIEGAFSSDGHQPASIVTDSGVNGTNEEGIHLRLGNVNGGDPIWTFWEDNLTPSNTWLQAGYCHYAGLAGIGNGTNACYCVDCLVGSNPCSHATGSQPAGTWALDYGNFGGSSPAWSCQVGSTGGGGMVYPGAGIPDSSGSAWLPSYTPFGSEAGISTSADPGTTVGVPMVSDGSHGQKPLGTVTAGCAQLASSGAISSTGTACGSGGGGGVTSVSGGNGINASPNPIVGTGSLISYLNFPLAAVTAPSGTINTSLAPTTNGNAVDAYSQNGDGTWDTYAGVDTFCAAGGPLCNVGGSGSSGTPTIYKRTWFNDTKVSPPGFQNSFVLVRHQTGNSQLSQTNDDRAMAIYATNAAGDTSAHYSIQGLQVEADMFGTPTFYGSNDGDIAAGSFQTADGHTGNVQIDNAMGVAGIRITTYHQTQGATLSQCGITVGNSGSLGSPHPGTPALCWAGLRSSFNDSPAAGQLTFNNYPYTIGAAGVSAWINSTQLTNYPFIATDFTAFAPTNRFGSGNIGYYAQDMTPAIAINSFTGSSGTLTFATAAQSPLVVAGEVITLRGFFAGGAGLTGQQVTVASVVDSTHFTAVVTGSGYSSDSGYFYFDTPMGDFNIYSDSQHLGRGLNYFAGPSGFTQPGFTGIGTGQLPNPMGGPHVASTGTTTGGTIGYAIAWEDAAATATAVGTNGTASTYVTTPNSSNYETVSLAGTGLTPPFGTNCMRVYRTVVPSGSAWASLGTGYIGKICGPVNITNWEASGGGSFQDTGLAVISSTIPATNQSGGVTAQGPVTAPSISDTGLTSDGNPHCVNETNGVLSNISGNCGSGGGGGVTSITAGTGLTGGTITTSGTIAVDTTVVPTLAASTNAFTGSMTIGGNLGVTGNLNLAGTLNISCPSCQTGVIWQLGTTAYSNPGSGYSAVIADSTANGGILHQVENGVDQTPSGMAGLNTTIAGKVANTTTVNGHALSSNVVVSASDLTTGTLPHAQLPALVSGDIPNNAANTTGTAANVSGTPALPNGTAATTQAATDSSTKIATTAMVHGLFASNGGAPAQSLTASANNYLTDSALTVGTNLQVGSLMHWNCDLTKTSAGTTGSSWVLYAGTTGTTSDTSLATVSFTGTAAADTTNISVDILVLTTGASATAVYSFNANKLSGGAATGWYTTVAVPAAGSTATFNTGSNLIFGLGLTTGASYAVTNNMCMATATNL